MKKQTIKKIALYTLSTVLLLTVVLCVHIYYVYRPKAPTSTTKIMARIDIKQQLNQADANKITSWLYRQKGIDHVLVNPQSNIVVFTFYPIKTSGNKIVQDFKANFAYQADRILPTESDLKNGCPVAASSYTYKIYKFISNII